MTHTEPNSRTRSRLLAASFAAVALALTSGTAFAATGPASVPGPSKADLAGAVSAASDPQAVDGLSTFFAHLDARASGNTGLVSHAEKAPAAAAAEHPRVADTAQAVYVLNPAFVKASSAEPVAQFAFAAVRATSARGVPASVWIGKDRHTGHWSVINTISGSDEVAYPQQGKGDLVFSEPQTDSWYRVHSGRVLPLNGSARHEVGAKGASLAAYQKLVHGRYADKMPGSAYQKAGKLGGFPTEVPASPTDDHAAASTPVELAGGGLTAAIACGGAWLLHRRRRAAD